MVPETVARAFTEQLAAGPVRFVTRDNEDRELEALQGRVGDKESVHCEGCERGDVPTIDQIGGYHWHAAPEIEVAGMGPMRGQPFRCLKLSRDQATAQSAD